MVSLTSRAIVARVAGRLPVQVASPRRTTVARLAALGVGAALLATPSAALAWPHHHDRYGPPAAAVIGGLAIGALAGAAAAGAFAPPPPVYLDEEDDCYFAMRRVWVEGLGWRRRQVEVCE